MSDDFAMGGCAMAQKFDVAELKKRLSEFKRTPKNRNVVWEYVAALYGEIESARANGYSWADVSNQLCGDDDAMKKMFAPDKLRTTFSHIRGERTKGSAAGGVGGASATGARKRAAPSPVAAPARTPSVVPVVVAATAGSGAVLTRRVIPDMDD
jgi:hypothetical protein